MDAQGELSGLGSPLVGAGEVADEGLGEINLAVMELAGCIKGLLVREGGQPIGLAALLTLGR